MADITVKLPNLANQTAIVNALNKIAQQTLDVRSLVSQAVKDNWKTIYPVGSIYVSVSSTSPASLFGGSWEQIQDRFLLAAGSTYGAGTTGGEAAHTLTTNEMPSHAHLDNEWLLRSYNAYTGPGVRTTQLKNEYNIFAAIHLGKTADNQSYTSSVGGNGAHNNMPPYISVYMWKRVA